MDPVSIFTALGGMLVGIAGTVLAAKLRDRKAPRGKKAFSDVDAKIDLEIAKAKK